ncbi:hypothetical protein EVAR_62420_1 [Eumeta japonica]|uniref:Uncharacterized protein n=1 Tax=Eumeta variegata TaxID=151549 RepID=A0A4C1ZM67_EUMVA|nr:hypothetical protein EVAR_62420_1 [Eumeta japonica]
MEGGWPQKISLVERNTTADAVTSRLNEARHELDTRHAERRGRAGGGRLFMYVAIKGYCIPEEKPVQRYLDGAADGRRVSQMSGSRHFKLDIEV